MMICRFLLALLISTPFFAAAQHKSALSEHEWVDSVFKSLNEEQRIAQLIVVRAHSNLGQDHIDKVTNDIRKYNVGALCFFQGGPVRQANLTNFYQGIAQTPIMVTIDGEYGLGMRLDSVTKFPYQLTLGALQDSSLVYRMGIAVGEQCKRLGVHVNYAPVVDINNNPNNPVIGYRSFGEDKNKVARLGVAYMRGMQDAGIMACGKHFPGHGDVDVDSHYDLPMIKKVRSQLDSMELVPFRALIDAGVGSMMIAHLYIPAIDKTANRATSISKNSVTGILREDLGYQGLTFTDALEMKGVAKFFPGGTISVEALIAGNDMLCLPASVPETIDAVKAAIKEKKLSWADINEKCKKVLTEKYKLGLAQMQPIDTNNLLTDLNAKTDEIRREVARKALTWVKMVNPTGFRNEYLSLPLQKGKKIAYVGFGTSELNSFGKRLQDDLGADAFFFSYKDNAPKGGALVKAIYEGKYDAVVLGFHGVTPGRANNYGISKEAIKVWNQLNAPNSITMVFGNVLSLANFCAAQSLVSCNENDDIFQHTAADWLEGQFVSEGTLPVRVCNWKYGEGLTMPPGKTTLFPVGDAKFKAIDSIATDAIAQHAFPGCVVLAAKDGQIVYHKAFGEYQYEPSSPVTLESIFDMASVTKISATTVAVMKLYEQGKIGLDKKLGQYLPWVKGTNKANLLIKDILLHQAGLIPFIQFYKETLDPATGLPNPAIYASSYSPQFPLRVANGMYIRSDWRDTLRSRILTSRLGAKNAYVYSDLDFIFLGDVVEAVTKMPLDKYVQDSFYAKMNMATTGFRPLTRFAKERIVPTENDNFFRQQLLQGDVHDEGSAMFGEVAGHAGLFSDAYDLAKLYQMLLNGGELNGKRFLKLETIRLFTSYESKFSRRGYGYDKPEKDNDTRKEPYPSSLVSPQTFGHTGYTGTCVWTDPKYNIIFVFLSNRVYPTRENSKLSTLQVRSKIQDEIYRVLGAAK
ncbi:MAG TPA: glycoside hydrolase family 3 N-terminal domain-containing protein [Chitinophagaceae bacterium]|nr:glycoside hydrolase family 3 N-terminal domain-containing protein [Chitinophagaceae bacterium]